MKRVLGWFMRPGGISCARVAELVQGYLDGELSDAERDRLARHLDRCEPCGIEAETYQQIKRSLSAPQPVDAVDRLTRYATALGVEQSE